jgi:hypothetical protein
MRRLLWAFGWVGVAFWSLMCALAYGLFDLVGRGFMRNADSFSSSPETVESIWKFFSFVHSFSTGAVLVVWAIVSLMILAVPWAIDRTVGRPDPRAMQPPQGGPYRGFGRPDPRGVIDLPPDQYSVGGRPGEAASGAAPRIPPRA